MKKQLLLGAFLIGSLLTANAQNTSFEESEGFQTGQLNGQQGWNITTGTGAANPALLTISTADATNGTQSLFIEGGNGGQTEAEHTLRGAFSPTFEVSGDMLYFSFDIKTSDIAETGSDFYISAQSPSQELLTSRIVFSYDGTVYVLDYEDPTDPQSLSYIEVPEYTYTGSAWHNVQIIQNNTAETIEYYIDGNLVYTGAAFGATNIEQVVIQHDNYQGFAYVDNIGVTNTLGTGSVIASQFSVYPNPTTNVINIANAENILVNGVEIVDINGRTVKSVKFDNVSEAQINISDLSAGMYLMNIASDKGTTTKKIVKN